VLDVRVSWLGLVTRESPDFIWKRDRGQLAKQSNSNDEVISVKEDEHENESLADRLTIVSALKLQHCLCSSRHPGLGDPRLRV